MNKSILKIALPSILTNVTVPLLGLVDTAIVGHLGSAAYIGAIALGTTLMSMAYWGFGFLRMSTGGLTAQAVGEGSRERCFAILTRSLTWALLIAAILLLLQVPLLNAVLYFAEGTKEVQALAATYFRILIWGAPAVLCLSSINGWFIGMQNATFPLLIAVVQNLMNILLSCIFVFGLGWSIKGVALGTLIAQYIGLLLALSLILRFRPLPKTKDLRTALGKSSLLDTTFLRMNRDIFLRTLCLLAVTSYFTFVGTRQGDLILASNALLMQFFLLFSYFMDGFAYAGEALCGKAFGANNRDAFRNITRRLFVWGGSMALVTAMVYYCLGTPILELLTDTPEVVRCATEYLPFVALIPLVSFPAFLFDGIFIGMSFTSGMLRALIVATVIFFALHILTSQQWGNTALWVAFLVYLVTRGIVQAIALKRKF
jgi:MATE family multidrug resistance protein